MDPNELKALVDLFYLLGFTVGLTLIAIRLWARIQEYRRAHEKIPWLLWRDVAFFSGLALPFDLILLVRAAGIGPLFRDEIAWSIMIGTPAVIGVWFWFWVEEFSLRGPNKK